MVRLTALALALCAAWTAIGVELPVTDVVLFSTGVGYVQRSGTVKDTSTVELSFRAEEINDLLKSMVLLDLDGGRVGAVTYGAQDPVGKTLGAFAVDITDDPTLGALLGRLRGVPAEVTVAAGKISGAVVGVETKTRTTATGSEEAEEVLTLMSDAGLRRVKLDEVTSLRLLDERMNRELQDALKVVASGLDAKRRPVVATFTGTGERKVVIGYLTEAPLWKTSYRLVTGEKETLLQGWAIVENTSDADWKEVRLSLVSGRPISFTQDLYTPRFMARPEVKPEEYASIGPVSYAANLYQMNSFAAATGAAAYRIDDAGSTVNTPGVPAPSAEPPPPPRPRLAKSGYAPYEMQQQRAQQWSAKAANDSVVSAAVAQDLGQAFEYNLTAPVSLPRQKSAMLPIVAAPVTAKNVSIYNRATHEKFPLYGMQIVNTTGMHLMGGPVTVYRDDKYAGDALIDDLKPGEKRLLSFAIDLGVEAAIEQRPGSDEFITVALEKGVLKTQHAYRKTLEYRFKVKDGRDRTVVVEHPYSGNWELKSPEKADEKTANLHRFFVNVTAKDGGRLTVTEERIDTTRQALESVNAYSLRQILWTGKARAELAPIIARAKEMQDRHEALRGTQGKNRSAIREAQNEQQRVRENLRPLNASNPTYKRYATKLGDLETKIEKLRAENERLESQVAKERKELAESVKTLTL